MKATVFLGGGRITGALCAGLRLAGDRRKIVVYDRHPEKLKALRRESHV
jgi:pyrroline-5-carboxylate reductase